MVLKARREHKARSERFNKRKKQVISAQLRAGVKPADIDMTQILFGPEFESGESDSDYEDEEEDGEDLEPTVAMKAGPPNTNPQAIGESIEPTVVTKGIRVFGAEEPSTRRRRKRGTKKKRGGQSNKRKRDSTYKYDGDSEDEEPSRKTGKKRKSATGDANADGDDLHWKAQTRAAARRAGHFGMDGSYDDDKSKSSAVTVSGTDGSSDLGDDIAGAARGGSVAGGNEGSGLVIRPRLLPLLASLNAP